MSIYYFNDIIFLHSANHHLSIFNFHIFHGILGFPAPCPWCSPSLASCGWYIGVASFGQPKCARHSPRSRNQRRVRLRAWQRSSPDAMFGFGYSDNHRTHMKTYIYVYIYICIHICIYIIYIYICICII